MLELKELEKLLRRGSAVELDSRLTLTLTLTLALTPNPNPNP